MYPAPDAHISIKPQTSKSGQHFSSSNPEIISRCCPRSKTLLQIIPRLMHSGRNTRKSSSGVTLMNAQNDIPASASASAISLIVTFWRLLIAHANVVPVNIAVARTKTPNRILFEGCRSASFLGIFEAAVVIFSVSAK
jgi:hypothetical protein